LKRRTRRYAQDLRLAIDCLPVRTREAMLDGLHARDIIVGAYTTSDGGICPMLAAHRAGGRTSLAAFAKAWDRYTGAAGRPRRASGRELRALHAMLEASLWAEDPRSELETAVRETRAAKARRDSEPRRHERLDTGERDRGPELRRRPGWSWLGVFRRYDDFAAALEHVEAGERERDPELV
jgi:hypothetical protein